MSYTAFLINEDEEVAAVFGDFATKEEAQAFGKRASSQLEGALKGHANERRIGWDILEKSDDPETQLEELIKNETRRIVHRVASRRR